MEGFEKFEGNPFQRILSQLGSGQGQPPQQPQMGGIMGEDPNNEQLTKGKTGDNSQNLMRAMQALHRYIADSTDSGEIAMGRSILLMLNKLIEKDQSSQNEKLTKEKTSTIGLE